MKILWIDYTIITQPSDCEIGFGHYELDQLTPNWICRKDDGTILLRFLKTNL